jgi:hypothetical protein
VWPVLLGALHLATRRARQAQQWIRATVAVAAVLSAIAALQVETTDLVRAYYGTDTRAYELLAGALLALTPSIVARATGSRAARPLAALSVLAVLALASSLIDLTPIERGIAITVVAIVLLVTVEASAPSGGVAHRLSQPLVTYLGRVSYGTYLWHWPFIVLLSTQVTLAPPALAALTCVVATGLAALSHELLERRVRRSRALDARPSAVIAAGLAISLVAGLVLVPAVLGTKDATALDVDWQAAQADNPPMPECGPDDTAACTVAHGSGPHVLLLGDSNARMYIPALTAIAQQEDLTLSLAVRPLCPWPRDLFFLKGSDACDVSKTFWYDDLMDTLDPDVVVVSQRPIDDPANPVGFFAGDGWFNVGTPGYDEALEATVRQTVQHLQDEGREVVLLEPIPIAERDDDPLSCLSSATSLDECTYEANAEPTPLEVVYRSEADGQATWSLDLDELVCPALPTCDPVVDGLIVKRDTNHITGTSAAHLADAIGGLLRAEGILDG